MCWHYKLLLKYVFILPEVEFAYKLENGILNWLSFMHDTTHMQIPCGHNICMCVRTEMSNMKEMHMFCCTDDCLTQALSVCVVCVCCKKPVLYFHKYCTVVCTPSLLVYIYRDVKHKPCICILFLLDFYMYLSVLVP